MSHSVTYCTQKILNTIKLLFIIGGVEWKNKHGYAIIDRFCERYLVYALEMLPLPPSSWRLHKRSSKIALEILKAATN